MKVFNYHSDYAHQSRMRKQTVKKEETPVAAIVLPEIPQTNAGDKVQGGGEGEAVAAIVESLGEAASKRQKAKKKEKVEGNHQEEEPEVQ